MGFNEQPSTVSYLDSHIDTMLKAPELTGIRTWYEGQLANLGEITVTPAPLTDGDRWRRELTSAGEVDKVDGAFFTLQGQAITKYNPDGSVSSGWTQPGLLQKEGEIEIPPPEGSRKIKFSGAIGIIKDANGNVLLTVAQEPFAQTPKRALARTPFQTSSTKLQGIVDGNRDLDPTLYDLIASVATGKSPSEIFQMGDVSLFPLSYADANRIAATNIGFVLAVTDAKLAKKLESDGKNRWCSIEEVKGLTKAGLLNGLTATAIFATS
ncbi:MAG: hypothetical protein A2186_00245 [Candidatus Levybacteria bacterium RIFOXYA1_FULL_41_10]|nr:MAG: hypothetical protein A2186_00245 [Candidatus Levybacteria bacterium RIFOXYA1_FULL_41_10]